MIKTKFGDHVRSKTDVAQENEVLCKVLAHNLCCLVMSIHELGIEPEFWRANQRADECGDIASGATSCKH